MKINFSATDIYIYKFKHLCKTQYRAKNLNNIIKKKLILTVLYSVICFLICLLTFDVFLFVLSHLFCSSPFSPIMSAHLFFCSPNSKTFCVSRRIKTFETRCVNLFLNAQKFIFLWYLEIRVTQLGEWISNVTQTDKWAVPSFKLIFWIIVLLWNILRTCLIFLILCVKNKIHLSFKFMDMT